MNRHVSKLKILSTIVLLNFALLFISNSARADLQVFPLRVVLSDKIRFAQVSLRHKGNTEMRYRITPIFYRMGTDGSMKEVETPTEDDRFAGKLFRFSPRQISLEPNIEQTVRLAIRLPADLRDGEYRAHLRFEEMDSPESEKKEDQNPTGAKMALKAHLAVAIPVIVRKNADEPKLTLSGLKLVRTPDHKLAYQVELSKEGASSAYGDIEIKHTPTGGSESVVGIVKGVSTYIPKRSVSFPLLVDELPPGTLNLNFKDSEANGSKVRATTSIQNPAFN